MSNIRKKSVFLGRKLNKKTRQLLDINRFYLQRMNYFIRPSIIPTSCDVCIVTNLKFPGGNASSTLEDMKVLMACGLSVRIIHCPDRAHRYSPFSRRYSEAVSICHDYRDIKSGMDCRILVVRHPAAICSRAFALIRTKIQANAAFFILNNSIYMTDGKLVYKAEDVETAVKDTNASVKKIFPVGPVIREELKRQTNLLPFLADDDWSPVFSEKDFFYREPDFNHSPLIIGRHTRDAPEKWPDSKNELALIYPERPDIRVRILGGADKALDLWGYKPSNWEILRFGSMHPRMYLEKIDVFVYFPHKGLNDAFPRNVMEAIFTGVPCLVPDSFRQSFGSMVIYCKPENIMLAIARLKKSGPWCISFTKYAHSLAIQKYGSHALTARLARNVPIMAGRFDLANYADLGFDTSISPKQFMAYASWVATGESAVDYSEMPND